MFDSKFKKIQKLFNELSPEEKEKFLKENSEVFEKNKAENQEKRKKLEKLYDSYLKKMKEINFLETIINFFADKDYREEVISKAVEMDIPDNRIPFLFITTKSYLGVNGLMSLVHNGDKKGVSYLSPNEIKDIVEVPEKGLYVIYDVENGKEILGKSPRESEELIKKEGRSCLTSDEGINLCIFTKVLSDHYVDCTGSRYEVDRVPFVGLYDDEVPKLGWFDFDFSVGLWGSASCRSRS